MPKVDLVKLLHDALRVEPAALTVILKQQKDHA